jgi:hypothetical protein
MDADKLRSFASATCGGKNINRFAIMTAFMPERHMALLPGQVAQVKIFIVCACPVKFRFADLPRRI